MAHMAGVSYARLSLVERGQVEPTAKWLHKVNTALAHHMIGNTGDAA